MKRGLNLLKSVFSATPSLTIKSVPTIKTVVRPITTPQSTIQVETVYAKKQSETENKDNNAEIPAKKAVSARLGPYAVFLYSI